MFLCPVCGFERGPESRPFDHMPPGPWAGHPPPPYARVYGSSAFRMCWACGFESGYDDNAGANGRNVSFERYLREWLARGGHWSRKSKEQPADWDISRTLARIGKSLEPTDPDPEDVLVHLPGARLPVRMWALRCGPGSLTTASARVVWPFRDEQVLVYGDRLRVAEREPGASNLAVFDCLERLSSPNQCWTLGPISRATLAGLQARLQQVFALGGFWDCDLRPRSLHVVFPEGAAAEPLALVDEIRAFVAAHAPSAATIERTSDRERVQRLVAQASAKEREAFRTAPHESAGSAALVVVAEDGGSDVGLAWATRCPEEFECAWIGGLWVAPDERRKLLGSRLLEALLHWAREAGYLSVRTEIEGTNHTAAMLVSQMGLRSGKRALTREFRKEL